MIRTNSARYSSGFGTNIDWLSADTFFDSLAAGKTYTFSNQRNGTAISLTVTNTSGSTITLTFPAGVKWATGQALNTVAGSTTSVFTMLYVNGSTVIAVVDRVA